MAAHQDEIDRDERQKVVHAAQAKRWKLDMQRANAELAEKAKMVDHKKNSKKGVKIRAFSLRLIQQTSSANNSAGIINRSSVDIQKVTE